MIPWYVIGIVGMLLVIFDLRTHNTPLKRAMKWAWQQKMKAHHEYEQNMFRRVNGAVMSGAGVLVVPAWLMEVRDLRGERRTQSAHTIDATHRLAEVVQAGASPPAAGDVLREIRGTKHALHMGNEHRARQRLETAPMHARGRALSPVPAPGEIREALGHGTE